ncbi:helix-turn-helix domain-containing protein [Nocardia rhamnosiphila]
MGWGDQRLRTEAGMSQRVLAGRIGYSRQYVSMAEWEDGNLPSRELVAAVDSELAANAEHRCRLGRMWPKQKRRLSAAR